MSTHLPHLERALEILWEAGHPRIASALEGEVDALIDKVERLETVLYPKAVPTDDG
jgi:hypothetical protein